MENPAEVQELRNKLRMMKFPQGEVLNTVRRQQRAIYKQKQSNTTIREEIDQYEGQIAHYDQILGQYSTNETLLNLDSRKKALTNKLSQLQADFKAEDQKRRRLEEEVSKARSKAGGIFKQAEENEAIRGKVHTMENRLDKSLLRYNNNLTKLGALRSQLDELRKDRNTFRDVIRREKGEREKREQKIGTLISNSNEAYARRDTFKMRLTQVKAAEKESMQTYQERLTRLNETIEAQKITKGHAKGPAQPISQTSSQIGSSSEQQEELTTLTETYNAATTRILESLGKRDVDELIESAENLERENFSLYNFVVEHGSRRSELQDQLEAHRARKHELDVQSEMTEEEQSVYLVQLTEKINESEVSIREKKEMHHREREELGELYSKVENLFNVLGCSWDGCADEKTSINPGNAPWVMSCIEEKLAGIMDEVYGQARIQYASSGHDPRPVPEALRSVSDLARFNASHRITADREVTNRVIEASGPLSIEELRELL